MGKSGGSGGRVGVRALSDKDIPQQLEGGWASLEIAATAARISGRPCRRHRAPPSASRTESGRAWRSLSASAQSERLPGRGLPALSRSARRPPLSRGAVSSRTGGFGSGAGSFVPTAGAATCRGKRTVGARCAPLRPSTPQRATALARGPRELSPILAGWHPNKPGWELQVSSHGQAKSR